MHLLFPYANVNPPATGSSVELGPVSMFGWGMPRRMCAKPISPACLTNWQPRMKKHVDVVGANAPTSFSTLAANSMIATQVPYVIMPVAHMITAEATVIAAPHEGVRAQALAWNAEVARATTSAFLSGCSRRAFHARQHAFHAARCVECAFQCVEGALAYTGGKCTAACD